VQAEWLQEGKKGCLWIWYVAPTEKDKETALKSNICTSFSPWSPAGRCHVASNGFVCPRSFNYLNC